MSATRPDQVTEFRRTPARTAPEAAEPSPRPLRSLRPERPIRRHGTPSYRASLVDIAPVLPTVGTVVTVFIYVGGPTLFAWNLHEMPLLIGTTAAIAVGFTLALLHRALYTAAEHAHPRSFAEIRQRVDSLSVQLRVLETEMTRDVPTSQRVAFEEAITHCRTLEQDLSRGGPQWVLGTGYVDAMTRLHRAEEALFGVQPTADVLAGAFFDELRIAGSTMPDREYLLAKLRTAVQALRPSAVAYLRQLPSSRLRSVEAGPTADAPIDALPVAAAHDAPSSADVEARIVLRDVRRALNDFRDESRARLIRSRGRLLGTMTMTGVITYVLVAFAISLDNSRANALNNPVAAAAAIYLVGAVVGLFNRLYLESGEDAAGEDYGLHKTRLLLTPMLSGLAAVGGVLITGMLSGVIEISAITPAAGGSSHVGALDLPSIFNLQSYPFALVLAAMFGLAPKTFLKRLQKVTDQSAQDLKSTAANQPGSNAQRGREAAG